MCHQNVALVTELFSVCIDFTPATSFSQTSGWDSKWQLVSTHLLFTMCFSALPFLLLSVLLVSLLTLSCSFSLSPTALYVESSTHG